MNKLNVFSDENVKQGKPAFGIDLGTTNSAIAVCKVNEFVETISLNGSTRKTMPSCVMWKGVPGEFIVGQEAYENREKANVVYSVKTLMQTPDATVTFKYEDKELTMTPAEVSAEILKALVKQTNGEYGEINDVVVTLPAYFKLEGVEATKKACELAGLNLLGIMREPTAASMCCKLDANTGSQSVMVYDLGGGTFDISLINIADNKTSKKFNSLYNFGDETTQSASGEQKNIQVIDTSGDTHLGGDDYDKELFAHFLHKVMESQHSFDESLISPEEREGMILRMEKYKKMGVFNTYDISYCFHLTNGETLEGSCSMTPNDFEEAFMPIYDRTLEKVHEVLMRTPAAYKPSQIVLVGGSTKNPILQNLLKASFPTLEINNSYNPDESVARGAAIQAKRLKFGSGQVNVFDILPIGVGIKTRVDNGYAIDNIIPRGTRLPYSVSSTYSTTRDNQDLITLDIYQGDSVHVDECTQIGLLNIDQIKPASAGTVNIGVRLSINADSIMSCHAVVDGKEREIKIALAAKKDSTCVSKEERQLIRWKATAETLLETDKEIFLGMLKEYPSKYTRTEVVQYLQEAVERSKCEN